MNKMTMMGVWLIALFSTGCNQDLVEYNSNDLKISIEKGENWCYQRGVESEDGLYLPTKKSPLVDGITGATPQGSFQVKMVPTGKQKQFIVKVEINHSADFNEAFPKSAKEGDANYTGGKEGSGQPALVYAAEVDLTSGKKEFTAKLIGHSSPDGSNGEIVTDTSSLTTALHIVKSITIHIQ